MVERKYIIYYTYGKAELSRVFYGTEERLKRFIKQCETYKGYKNIEVEEIVNSEIMQLELFK